MAALPPGALANNIGIRTLPVRPVSNVHKQVYIHRTANNTNDYRFYHSSDLLWKMLANEDRQNTDATYNALSEYHNPHMAWRADGTFAHPHVTPPYPQSPRDWSRVSRLVDKTTPAIAPRNLQALVSMTLAQWFVYADQMGWDWRNFRHGADGRAMIVPFARAKYCVKIGVFHKVPLRYFYQPDISVADSLARAHDARIAAGPRPTLFPGVNHQNGQTMHFPPG
ncbi:hypothetical protein BJ508DRAFT_334524 [Ascobolus immersus RN42]|uniref:Uncharacterized protein n=1 Tax=Ascobolus immersus RN42 TaxID=1160509 RepID=A0A3N4HTJ5_ASCIM|nr:hypothetical protein BJ508DRAFT_334524 [Ascobolus immersus RN42]